MRKKDIGFGLEQEIIIKDKIEKFLDIKIKKSKNKFCNYDFKGKGVRIELKSRRINSDSYPTTFLCKTKLDYYNKIKDKKKFLVIFNFLDKIKYIEFNEDLQNLPIKKVYVKRGEFVENIEIDVNLLKDLSV